MSGILGAWNLDDRPMDAAVLAGMSHALGHRGPDGEGRRLAGSVGFACQHRWVTEEEIGEVQPLVGRAGLMLVMDGRLDNRLDLLAALRLSKSVSDAALALASYESWRDSFAEHLNGDFSIAVFDLAERRLVLVRDAIGVRPLYYFRADRLFVFASEIKALLAHPDVPRRPDDEGIADFMLISARPADRQAITCFAGISALVPAHLAVVTPQRTVTRRYWDFDTARSLALPSLAEYVEAFRERFTEAVRRRIRSAYPVAISLSGGLDSSSIFCEAERLVRAGAAGCPGVAGISYTGRDGTDADERRYLLDIEGSYGVEIERFPMEPLLGLVRGAETQIHAIEAPFVDYTWSVTEELHRRATQRGARVLLSGTWGDQMLFSSAYLIDLFRRLAWRTIWLHLAEYRRWVGEQEARALVWRFLLGVVRHHVPSPLLPPLKWVRRRLMPTGRPIRGFSRVFLRRALRFASQPASVGEGFHSAQARSIYFEARSKYHVHCMEWNNKIAALHGLDAALPFLDRDLIAFLMAIPGEVQNWDGIPRALLREGLRGVLPEGVRTRAWKANFTGAVNRGLVQDLSTIRQVLSPDSLGVRLGYLDAERLKSDVISLSKGLERTDSADGWSLADLFGLEVWLLVFLAGRPAQTVSLLRPREEGVR